MNVEVVELTEAQARELLYATTRVLNMLDSRQPGRGADRYIRPLRTLKSGLAEVQGGERDELRLSIGMKGEAREELLQWLEFEKEMMVYADDNGAFPKDGNELNALERGLDKLRNPETVPQEEIGA